MGVFKKITTVLLAVLVFSIGLGSVFFVVKSCDDALRKEKVRQEKWREFGVKLQQHQDSIKNEFTLLKKERDSLLFKYDSLSKIKKDAHIKKVNSYRTLSLDSNIVILSITLSKKDITW